jgi:long-chain acyl-CoA synthetase
VTDLAPENALLTAWKATLSRTATEPAIVAPDGTVLRTFADIESEADALRARLAGFSPCTIIALQIGNSQTWPALLIALFRACLIPMPLGRHMEVGEVARALHTCGAAALISSENGTLRIDSTATVHFRSWDFPAPHFLKLTSGTTSAPRAVRFRAEQLLADARNICRTMGIGRGDVNFGVIPFSHSYGFSNLITPLIAYGIPLVTSEDRMPRAILNDLTTSGATVFPGTPIFFQKLVELENASKPSSLRLCISAGAPLPKPVAERFAEKFGRKIHPFYGASECGGIAYDAGEAHAHQEGFVGTPMSGVRIEHPRNNEAAPIVVQSDAVGDAYYPEKDEAVLSGHRFRPSDLVRCDGDGLFIVGRSSDVINVAGRKLNPLELETRLLDCPGVKQAIVFGIPSTLRGEEPIACISTEPGTDSASIMRFCQAHLSAWQVPRDLWIVSEIPVNDRGKISRRTLADRYRAENR